MSTMCPLALYRKTKKVQVPFLKGDMQHSTYSRLFLICLFGGGGWDAA